MSTGRYFKTKKETIAGQRAIKKLKKEGATTKEIMTVFPGLSENAGLYHLREPLFHKKQERKKRKYTKPRTTDTPSSHTNYDNNLVVSAVLMSSIARTNVTVEQMKKFNTLMETLVRLNNG